MNYFTCEEALHLVQRFTDLGIGRFIACVFEGFCTIGVYGDGGDFLGFM